MAVPLESNPSLKSDCVKEHSVRMINTNGELHSLNRPVVLQVKDEGGTYFAENDFLEICGHGDTASEALDDAIKDIAYYYEYYGNLNENEVTGHGVTIRNRFLDL